MISIPVGITEIIEDEEGFYESYIHIIFRNSPQCLWQHKYWKVDGMTKKETKENMQTQLLALKKEIQIRKKESPKIEFKMIPELKIKKLEI